MADIKSETKTANAVTEPKAATTPVSAAPAARATQADAPAAEKAAAPAPKAEKAPEPAPKAVQAAKPVPAPAATAPKAAPAAAPKPASAAGRKAAPARRGRKAVPVTNPTITIQKKPVRKPAITKSVKAAVRAATGGRNRTPLWRAGAHDTAPAVNPRWPRAMGCGGRLLADAGACSPGGA